MNFRSLLSLFCAAILYPAISSAESSQYIVAFDDRMLKTLIATNKKALEASLKPILPSPNARRLATKTLTRYKSKVTKRLAKGKQKYLNLIDAKLLTLREGESVAQNSRVQYAVSTGLVKYVEPNVTLHTFGFNDPDLSKLWGISSPSDVDINGDEGWKTRFDTGDAVVAILDTGFDPGTADLKGNVWSNPGEIAGNGKDDDKNGYIDDVSGCDFITYEHGVNESCGAAPFHENDHGTHVAGTIGARANNGIGISGVAGQTQMISLAFLGANGSGSLADMVEAMSYAVQLKKDYKKSGGKKGANIKVMNASLGHSGGFLQSEFDAIEALGKADILLVAAAGNGGWDGWGDDNDRAPTYPASYNHENLIAVAAVGRSGNLTSFSNYGQSSVHVAAPGEAIYSTTLNNEYKSMSGTSMAAPHVAGAAAIIMGHKPEMPAWMVKQVLIASVKNSAVNQKLAGLNGKVSSSGMIDLKEALILSETNLDKPRVTSQPTDQSGFIKGKAAFRLSAIGAGPLEYSWAKDGAAINGATSAALSFSDLKASDAGFYTCTISNRYGTVTSNAVQLTVRENPPGDINGDGKIDLQDMIVMMTSLGKKGKGLAADMNRDGKVDLQDVQLLLVAMGRQ